MWGSVKTSRSEHLTLPQMQLEKAIGLFHVHGHKQSCLFSYASTFILGDAMVDGEILETNWVFSTKSQKVSTPPHWHTGLKFWMII